LSVENNVRLIFVSVNFHNNADDDDRSDRQLCVHWLPINEKDVADNAQNYVSNIIFDKNTVHLMCILTLYYSGNRILKAVEKKSLVELLDVNSKSKAR
jgi:hypothetical protein